VAHVEAHDAAEGQEKRKGKDGSSDEGKVDSVETCNA
jgi:hypothetical protein